MTNQDDRLVKLFRRGMSYGEIAEGVSLTKAAVGKRIRGLLSKDEIKAVQDRRRVTPKNIRTAYGSRLDPDEVLRMGRNLR